MFFSSFKIIHFIGIGGIGMSAIAELAYELGYVVQGSDIRKNNNLIRLEKKGISINIGHLGNNIKTAEVVVYSSAIDHRNPEIIEANASEIPLYSRAEFLSILMKDKRSITISGTHGKTTTTSIIGQLLQDDAIDPTVVSGGIMNINNSNLIFGNGDWMVVEADESDGSFLILPSEISIITNIDNDHLDYYKSMKLLKDAFIKYANNTPENGCLIVCIDDEGVQSILNDIKVKRLISYGFSEKANYQVSFIKTSLLGSIFSVKCNLPDTYLDEEFFIPMHGEHNINNAIASIVVARILSIDIKKIKNKLRYFPGIQRRFTKIGDKNGVIYFDDYAHHPKEIQSVLSAAKKIKHNKIVTVFQPHRYSRIIELYDGFCESFKETDYLLIAPIYSAGELILENITNRTIANDIKFIDKDCIKYFMDNKNLKILLKSIVKNGDIVIFIGAGDISSIAREIVQDI
ncbi:MAG: UDP-N-acetylmuramate--L-alanine ligase [Rhodobiaceae bacterium]|nr:UDP-N-acetylmuramate--L-alanine ligase [Rhodobiaceae bacterium]